MGTITDNTTGLMWQKATAGFMNWNDATSYASGLSLGDHSDWRLPNNEELVGLYNSPCKNMMDVVTKAYWSSSPYNSNRTNYDGHWCVNFGVGRTSSLSGQYNQNVRVVRTPDND